MKLTDFVTKKIGNTSTCSNRGICKKILEYLCLILCSHYKYLWQILITLKLFIMFKASCTLIWSQFWEKHVEKKILEMCMPEYQQCGVFFFLEVMYDFYFLLYTFFFKFLPRTRTTLVIGNLLVITSGHQTGKRDLAVVEVTINEERCLIFSL